MKNLLRSITIMFLLIGMANSVGATTLPPNDNEKVVMVNDANVTYSIQNLSDARSFNGVTYNNITKMLKIDSKENIAFVEILNQNGELEYFLPVGAKLLNIDVLDFAKGSYTVNIKMQEVGERIINTTLERNF